MIWKPSAAKPCAIGSTSVLSSLLTLTQTAPCSGSRWPAPSIALTNAMPKLSAPPITSPVDFISGPRMVSTPGKRTNGNTGLFTNTPAGVKSSVIPRSANDRPAMTRAATWASATPSAFDRYGTVRDARGFTSST
jgi:hypothetical protein